MADLPSVAALLKEVWAPSYETAFADEIVALRRIETNSENIVTDVSARYAVVPLKVARNQGIGSRAERTTLPTPGQQSWSSTKITLRYQYGVGDITGPALELADANPRSFINALEEEQAGLRSDVMFDYGRQVYGSSLGTIANLTTSSGAGLTLDVDSTTYIQRKMRLDVVNPSGPTLRNTGPLTVVSIDRDNKQITVSGTVAGVASGDVIVRQGNFNMEISGFADAISDSSPFQQVDTSEVPEWVSHVVTVNQNYSESILFKQFDFVRRTASKTPTAVFCGTGVWRSIYDNVVQDRQFVNTVEFAHGVDGIPLHYKSKEIPIVDDPQFPEDFGAIRGDMIGICEEDVKIYRTEKGWHFAEETGSSFIPATDRSDAWEFRMRQLSNLGYSLRNTHFRVNGINITA